MRPPVLADPQVRSAAGAGGREDSERRCLRSGLSARFGGRAPRLEARECAAVPRWAGKARGLWVVCRARGCWAHDLLRNHGLSLAGDDLAEATRPSSGHLGRRSAAVRDAGWGAALPWEHDPGVGRSDPEGRHPAAGRLPPGRSAARPGPGPGRARRPPGPAGRPARRLAAGAPGPGRPRAAGPGPRGAGTPGPGQGLPGPLAARGAEDRQPPEPRAPLQEDPARRERALLGPAGRLGTWVGPGPGRGRLLFRQRPPAVHRGVGGGRAGASGQGLHPWNLPGDPERADDLARRAAHFSERPLAARE
mmetsp:Transcript_44609/g.127281  ORF Transcript_44609/g.127281 Transcript_44609/m.127281 type:complete len:306 (-) Transcript_44609:580-1497(-)